MGPQNCEGDDGVTTVQPSIGKIQLGSLGTTGGNFDLDLFVPDVDDTISLALFHVRTHLYSICINSDRVVQLFRKNRNIHQSDDECLKCSLNRNSNKAEPRDYGARGKGSFKMPKSY